MSLQQRDCSGLSPDSLFIRRPEILKDLARTEQDTAKIYFFSVIDRLF